MAGSLSTLYFATILYFTRLPVAQVLALVLLTALAVALAYTIWLGPYELSGGDLGLKTSGSVRDIILGSAVALLGWWMYSEYLHLTRGYRLPIGLSQSSSLLIVIFCIAIAEELFFRSYTHARLSPWLTPLGRAVVVSVALAGYKNLVHFWEFRPILYHIELFVITFMLSVPLSLWREASGSITGPVVTHITWDLLVYGTLNQIPDWVF
jgi:membrane protease YdiL (CAAX protease family)